MAARQIHDSTRLKAKQAAPGNFIAHSHMVQTNSGGSLEPVPGFRIERALTEGFGRGRLPESALIGFAPQLTPYSVPEETVPPVYGANLENVIEVDDRVMVRDTSAIPWRCICQLIISYDDARTGFGTGWFAGPRTIITAAHCLVDPRAERKAAEVHVIPGRNGPVAPYGFHRTKHFAVADGWGKKDPDADFGAVFLPRPDSDLSRALQPASGQRLGYFGYEARTEATLDRLLVNNAGYPYEPRKPFGTLWYNAGRIEAVEERFLRYMIDTEAGQSGSPIFFYDEMTKDRRVVAIHTTGYFPNRGIRITEKVFEQIADWVKQPVS